MKTTINKNAQDYQDILHFSEITEKDIPGILSEINTITPVFTETDIREHFDNIPHKVNIHKEGFNLFHPCGCCNPFAISIYPGQSSTYIS